MAYIKKTKSGYAVKKGDTGKTLSTFTGKEARQRAGTELKRLHAKNKPLPSNRGKSAAKKNK